jgi:MOSC domain-containing protein YiiM
VSPKIISVNVGLPREATWGGETFTTAIVKEPITGPRRVEGVNLTGDDQADRTVHGGPTKAVYAYSIEDYEWWSKELGQDLTPGTFGENLTLQGIDASALNIGERWRAGTALLEVSEPRIPCFKLAWRMQSPTFPKRFGKAMRFGTYFRIIEEGEVQAGSPFTLERAAEPPTLPSRDIARIYMFDHAERQRLAPIAALAEHWRDWGAAVE